MQYYIKTFGCQYNEWDASRVDYRLQNAGLESSNENEADIVFVISCSVRQTAIDRLLGKVRNWQEAGKTVVISGCVLESDRKKYLEKKLLVWDINKPEELEKILSKDIIQIHNNNIDNAPTLRSESRHRVVGKKYIKKNTAAFLPIMTGCNNFCSYCVVPYTRGHETSRPFDEIVNNFKELVKSGNKEILLLGQNVNSYRIQNTDNSRQKSQTNDFATLLKTLNDIPGDFIISFTSNHPKDMGSEIIAAVRDLLKVKKEIHLPFQSGSDKILKAMNRPYTREKYLDLIKKIKKEIPNVKITTDVIVGFPGETEKDFGDTVDLIKKINFKQVFVNKFSPRAGTAAFELGDPIKWEEKERRWRILDKITNT